MIPVWETVDRCRQARRGHRRGASLWPLASPVALAVWIATVVAAEPVQAASLDEVLAEYADLESAQSYRRTILLRLVDDQFAGSEQRLSVPNFVAQVEQLARERELGATFDESGVTLPDIDVFDELMARVRVTVLRCEMTRTSGGSWIAHFMAEVVRENEVGEDLGRSERIHSEEILGRLDVDPQTRTRIERTLYDDVVPEVLDAIERVTSTGVVQPKDIRIIGHAPVDGDLDDARRLAAGVALGSIFGRFCPVLLEGSTEVVDLQLVRDRVERSGRATIYHDEVIDRFTRQTDDGYVVVLLRAIVDCDD